MNTLMTPRRSRLELLYLALTVLGFVLPGVPMVAESIETGNILFWTQPSRTTAELFANRTSTAFALDLFAVVLVAAIWMAVEAKRIGIGGVWRFYILLALFGLGGTLPLFLFVRERKLRGTAAPVGSRA